MDYQNYEDYMREVLGYQNMPNNNMYNAYPMDENYYERAAINNIDMDTEELESMFPDTYRIIYPMVSKVCNQNMNRKVTKAVLEEMVNEIYINFGEGEPQNTVARPSVRNGDVINPNIKREEASVETRQRNRYLEDFIRVLLLREFLTQRRPTFPPRPPHRPGPFQGGTGRPPMGSPPPHRPRGYNGLY